MICKFCGNEIEKDADFCFVCGQKVAAATEAEEPTQPDAQPDAVADAPAEPLPVSEPADPAAYTEVDPVEREKAGRFARFISFICPLIGVILYAVYTKRGKTGKKHSIANATMSGVCFYLIIAMVIVVKKSMF